jgi:hypothetical protein
LTNTPIPCGVGHVFYSAASITLLDSHNNPVNAVNRISLDVHNTDPLSCGSAAIHTFNIDAGESSSVPFLYSTYIGSGCPEVCPMSFDCAQTLNNASNLAGIGQCAGFTANNTPPPPPSPCPTAYATKTPRFPEYQNMAAGDIGSTAKNLLVASTQAQITAQTADICNANAANWISRLQPGLTAMSATPTQISNLTAALIGVCTAGGDQDHPMGASTVAPTATYPYSSFGDAIKQTLSLSGGKYTSLLNPWLIDAPYPFAPLQQSTEKVISNSNATLCNLLATYQTQATAAGQILYNYLVSTYGAAMTLSAADLGVLQNSCMTCKFILANDISLPVFLDPGNPGYITRTQYNTAKSALSGQFSPALSPTDPNYQTILSNYLNQTWGFSLTYDDYAGFEAGSAPLLCNTIPYSSVNADPYDCVKNAVSRAVRPITSIPASWLRPMPI